MINMIKTITALMVLTLIATVSTHNAYAIEGDGTSHVEVDEYPFHVTILEGGSMTLHNSGKNTINFVSNGWFEGSVPANDAIALEFPIVNCGTACFFEGTYYVNDKNGGDFSTITIVKPYVAPEPVYVESISQAENFTVEMTQNGFSTNELQINAGDSVTFVNTHYVTDINVEPHAISDPFAVPYTENSYWIIDDSTPERVYNFDSCESFVFYDRFFDVEPVVVQCNSQTVQGTASEPTYHTTMDGITTVDVFTIPFDVTITENGSVTVHNTDSVEHVVSHTGTTGTAKSGTFYKVIPGQQQTTIEFPITGNTIYESGVYTFEDTVTGKSGSITILPWSGSKQAIQDDTVTGISQGIVEQVGIQESIVVVLTPEPTLELIVDEGIYNVATYDGEVDLIAMQTQLAEVTAQFNDSITKLADQKLAIESHDNEVQSLTAKIGTLNGTATKVSTLEQTVLSLQLERDALNAQILTLGNTTAMQQTTIVKLNAQVNDTSILDGKITNLESQIVSLTSERDQWRQLANNWYGVAMEQLSVMINVLGI
jgi:uncharacterized coiled-coil protein SlyX